MRIDLPLDGLPRVHEPPYARELANLVRGSSAMMRMLRTVAAISPPDWVIGGGAIRNLVWDDAHAKPDPTPLRDVDVAYFDAGDTSEATEKRYEEQLSALLGGVAWEVHNQAAVHLWYPRVFGHDITAVHSIDEAVGRFPETCTSVGISLTDEATLRIIAPCGLDDLFQLRLRRNPAQVTYELFLERLRAKNITAIWPKVTVCLEPQV